MFISAVRLLVIAVLSLCAVSVGAQCPQMPSGFLCITQEAGNKAAENARLVPVLEAKNAVLEGAIVEKEKTITELKKVNQDNVRDLTGQMNKATAEAAFERGRIEQCNADKVLWSAVIPVLVQNTRQKTNGIKIF